MAKRKLVDFESWFDFPLRKKRKRTANILTLQEVIKSLQNLALEELEVMNIINGIKNMSIKERLRLGSTKLPQYYERDDEMKG